MEFAPFIAQLGGNFGLFLGASFMTFFELGELLIVLSFYYYKRKRSTKIVPEGT